MGIQNRTRQELEKRMDELARKYADSHGGELGELTSKMTRNEKTTNVSINGITKT